MTVVVADRDVTVLLGGAADMLATLPAASAYVTVCLPGCDHDAALVLDPFLESWTSAVAARQLGRRCIGIDLSEPYTRLTRHRLAPQTLDLEAT